MFEAMAKGKFTYTAWDRNQVSLQRRAYPQTATDLPYRKKKYQKALPESHFYGPIKVKAESARGSTKSPGLGRPSGLDAFTSS